MLCSQRGEAEMAWAGLSYPILQRGFALGTGQDSTPDLPAHSLVLELSYPASYLGDQNKDLEEKGKCIILLKNRNYTLATLLICLKR